MTCGGACCSSHCKTSPGGGLRSSHRPWLAAAKTESAAAYGEVLEPCQVTIWANAAGRTGSHDGMPLMRTATGSALEAMEKPV